MDWNSSLEQDGEQGWCAKRCPVSPQHLFHSSEVAKPGNGGQEAVGGGRLGGWASRPERAEGEESGGAVVTPPAQGSLCQATCPPPRDSSIPTAPI